jgi:hypothetical protein
MQLAYSKYLEDRRHNLVAEDVARGELAEKVRHNYATEDLTARQQSLDKYISELNAQVKREEIITRAQVDRLRIETDRAIADAKQNLSEREFENVKRKTTAEINKLAEEAKKVESETALNKAKKGQTVADTNLKKQQEAKTFAETEAVKAKTQAEVDKIKADTMASQSKAFNSFGNIVGTLFGNIAATAQAAGEQAGQNIGTSSGKANSSHHGHNR